MPLHFQRPLLLWVLAPSLLGLTSILPAQQPAAQQAAIQPPTSQPQPAIQQLEPQPEPQQPPKPRYWTKHWSFQDVDVKQLFSRLNSIGIGIPVDGEGDVSVEIDVSVPLASLSDAKAYRLSGHLVAKRLRLESLLLEDFDANFQYDDGVVRLDKVKGRWADATTNQAAGSFQGDASAHLIPRGDFQTTVKVSSLPIGPLHKLLFASQEDSQPIVGTLNGSLSFKSPIDQLGLLTSWTAAADLKIDDFRFGEKMPVSVVTGPIQIRDGIIQAKQVQVASTDSPDVRIDLATQVELTGRQRFEFRIRGNDVPLEKLAEIALQDIQLAAGKLDIDASGRGELGTESWNISGRLASPRLTVVGQELGLLEHQFGFDQQRFQLSPIDNVTESEPSMLLKRVSATYQLDEDSLNIAGLDAEVFGGTIKGTARLARKNSTNHELDLAWENMRLELKSATILPVAVSALAVTSGSIDWSVPSESLNLPQSHAGVVRVHLAQLGIGRAKGGDLQLRVEAREGTLTAILTGKLVGGNIQAETNSVAGQGDSWSTLLGRAPSGNAKADSIRLDAIAGALFPDSQRRWRGTASAQLDWQAGAESSAELKPTLQASVKNIAVDGRSLSRQLTMQLKLGGDVIAIDRVTGSYAGGSIRAGGNWSLGKGERRVQISFAGINAAEALLPISEQAASQVDGKVSGLIRVTNGDRLRFRGSVTARNSSFFSVPTGTVHSGINGSISRDLRRWEVDLPSVQGELAGGRIAGEARLSSSSIRAGAFDLSSRWQTKRIDFGELLAAVGSSSQVAHGRMTGQISLGGRGVRTTSDLVGRFDARLGATQAAAVPGLLKADPFLGVLSLQGLRFDEGGLQGVIGAGAATIDEFWLSSPRVKVWSDGKIYLANQRMDLDVIIATSNFGFGSGPVVAFASQLAIQSVLPITTLVEINRLLSNRTVHLDFLGTVADPRVRLKPLEIIGEEVARFLLRELLVAASVSNGKL
jgi:hypothetical protein